MTKKSKDNKTDEKGSQQTNDELRKSLQKFKAKIEVINDELLKPIEEKIESELEKVVDKLKKLDDKFAPDTEIHRKTMKFKSWAKKLRDEENKKSRKSKSWFKKHLFWIVFALFWIFMIITAMLYDKGMIR